MSISDGFCFAPGLVLGFTAICIALALTFMAIGTISDEIQFALRRMRHRPVVLWVARLTVLFIVLPIIAVAWAKAIINK